MFLDLLTLPGFVLYPSSQGIEAAIVPRGFRGYALTPVERKISGLTQSVCATASPLFQQDFLTTASDPQNFRRRDLQGLGLGFGCLLGFGAVDNKEINAGTSVAIKRGGCP